MARVGWYRTGREGRIKATRPGLRGSEVQRFWVVPPDWDDMPMDERVERR